MSESTTPRFELRISHADLLLLIDALRTGLVNNHWVGEREAKLRNLCTKLGGLEQDYLYEQKQEVEEPS